jgi:hypothetical protein
MWMAGFLDACSLHPYGARGLMVPVVVIIVVVYSSCIVVPDGVTRVMAALAELVAAVREITQVSLEGAVRTY